MNCDLRQIENVNYAWGALQSRCSQRAELWELAALLAWDAISGQLVGLCSSASMDSSLAGLPRLSHVPPLSALLFLRPENSGRCV